MNEIWTEKQSFCDNISFTNNDMTVVEILSLYWPKLLRIIESYTFPNYLTENEKYIDFSFVNFFQFKMTNDLPFLLL